ncbi:hypothetical protein COY07_02685 [Candidatus Peregrinibacteria bacterium CG_4_10_14_0_2_um_filter_43_11]|nr:MAG: hypothetical protein COY07_02685 [Candidatus Peregrinibacteria bacterium CG_4_10_14_0_2_um_filter_43_11]
MHFFIENYRQFVDILKKIGALKIALIVFGVLVLFILIVEKPGSSSMDKIVQGQPLLFPRFSVEMITHITITPSEASFPPIALRHVDEKWFVDDYVADAERVAGLLYTLENLKKESVVSNNPSRQLLFGADSVSGTSVQIWKNSKELIHFYAGKPTETESQYLRLDGDNEVLQVTPAMTPFLNLSVEAWQGKPGI